VSLTPKFWPSALLLLLILGNYTLALGFVSACSLLGTSVADAKDLVFSSVVAADFRKLHIGFRIRLCLQLFSKLVY